MNKKCVQTEKLISFWNWSELMVALKSCKELQSNTSSLTILDKFLDSITERILLSYQTSPSPSISSIDSSGGFTSSCETGSTKSSSNNSGPKATWWYKDLSALDIDSIETLVKFMVSRNFDHSIISTFLFYYQKSKFNHVSTDLFQKIKIIEKVVQMLLSLDVESVSFRSLFHMLSVARNVNSKRSCLDKLENMIGSHLDHATLDDLLVPSPYKAGYIYDVNMVVRLLKSFLEKGVCCVLSRLKKVADLMDLYLVEVAPDPYLNPSRFLALIRALPNSARENCDGVHRAVNLYLEVHSSLLSEEQRMKLCFESKYEKLSNEALNHLIQNKNYPSESCVNGLVSQQRKLKSLLRDTNLDASIQTVDDNKVIIEKEDQIVLYATKFNHKDENGKVRAHLKGMQWRAVELENIRLY